MSIERFVAFILTPVLTAASAWLTGAVAKYGIHLDQTGITSTATAGAVGAAAAAIHWLHGRQNPLLLGLEHDVKTVAAKAGVQVDLDGPGDVDVLADVPAATMMQPDHDQVPAPAVAPAIPQSAATPDVPPAPLAA